MRYVSASDAKQRLASVLDTVQREPVTIRRQNREVAVVLSPADYLRLQGANIEQFQQFCDRIAKRAKSRGLAEGELEKLHPRSDNTANTPSPTRICRQLARFGESRSAPIAQTHQPGQAATD